MQIAILKSPRCASLNIVLLSVFPFLLINYHYLWIKIKILMLSIVIEFYLRNTMQMRVE